MDKYLEVKDVHFNYFTNDGELAAVDGLTFDVKKGEFIAIVGPSGCGKTTILSLVAGLLKPISGEILLEGKIADGKNIGYMFQRDQLFDWRSIYKNILLGEEIKNGKKKAKEKEQYIIDLLTKYGLIDFKDKHPNELSGGMRQRAALIRTLAVSPKLLLLDEPFSALDFQTRLDVCDDVKKIIKEQNQTALLVTHDIAEAISMAERVIILTKRPTRVRKIVEMQFDSELSPLKRRDNKSFSGYFNLIWEELNNEKQTK